MAVALTLVAGVLLEDWLYWPPLFEKEFFLEDQLEAWSDWPLFLLLLFRADGSDLFALELF